MSVSCCKDCDKRYVGCHSECEDYILEKQDHDKKSEIIRSKRKAYEEVVGAMYDFKQQRQKNHRSYDRTHKVGY